jgi:DNA-binding CsgD family transcriptional regulator
MNKTPKVLNGGHTNEFSEIRTIRIVHSRLHRLDHLSRRQREVLRLIAAGATNNQICGRLGIAGPTVENHIKELKHRLDVSSRSLLAIIGYFEAVSVALLGEDPETAILAHLRTMSVTRQCASASAAPEGA